MLDTLDGYRWKEVTGTDEKFYVTPLQLFVKGISFNEMVDFGVWPDWERPEESYLYTADQIDFVGKRTNDYIKTCVREAKKILKKTEEKRDLLRDTIYKMYSAPTLEKENAIKEKAKKISKALENEQDALIKEVEQRIGERRVAHKAIVI